MKRIIHPNATQCQFDFDSLSLLPVPDNTEVGLEITQLPEPQQETQEWWSGLEYQKIPRKPGIYAIININNRHFYIGSAVNLSDRKRKHFSDLSKNKHVNSHLQNAYNCYGADAFRFAIIDRIANKEDLISREQHYIDTLNPEYNIARVAGSNIGMKFTDEHKAKIGKASKGRTHKEESKIKIGEASKGREKSEETRNKLSEALKGREVSEATRAKIGKAHKGREKSEEERKNISEAKKGTKLSPESVAKREATKKTRREDDPSYGKYSKPSPKKGKPRSEETKAKISVSLMGHTAHNKGKPMSEDQKARISIALMGNTNGKGHTHSEETKKQLSEAKKGKKRSPESIAKQQATRAAKREADPTYGKKK
jgi:group I intron endonuclease